MDKSRYLMDVLTPVAVEKLYETHQSDQIEFGELPFFPNSDSANARLADTFKEANEEIIEDLKSRLAYAHYELASKTKLKAMMDGIGRISDTDVEYANGEVDTAESDLNYLMEKYKMALKVKSNLDTWFR